MLDVLNLPKVNRLLVLNAGSHGDTLDDVVSSFKSSGIQQAILSKVDEAAKVGPALDAIIRHQLVLRGVTMGQKVPEDWEQADAAKLVRLSMRAPLKSAFDPKPADLGFFFAQPTSSHAGRFDA
jgi:flagellar biosynthesis protein FlhF